MRRGMKLGKNSGESSEAFNCIGRVLQSIQLSDNPDQKKRISTDKTGKIRHKNWQTKVFRAFASAGLNQCCGSKYIVFESGSRNLLHFGSGFKAFQTVALGINFEKIIIKNVFIKLFFFFCGCGSRSVFGIRIRIHKIAEHRSNLDPDPPPPQH